MSERPILFSGPMVRAILAGNKTQTRRVVKPQPAAHLGDVPGPAWNQGFVQVKCPYGVPGDTLFVRETWAHVPKTAYRCSEGVQQTLDPNDSDMAAVYCAGWDLSAPGRWRPSIHMPRWASRLSLRVQSVRVERLQEISEEDARAEGVCADYFDPMDSNAHQGTEVVLADSCRDSFATLWDSINGKRAPWASNPWVWVVTFEKEPSPGQEKDSDAEQV